MTTLVGLYLLVLIGVLWLFVIAQHLRGTHDLISVRNMALVGFTVFQLTSALFPLFGHFRTPYLVQDEAGAAIWFAFSATLFLGVFLLFYEQGFFVKKLARRMPVAQRLPTISMLWTIAVLLTIASSMMRLAWMVAPILAGPGSYLTWGFAAVSSGLVGWSWGKRLYNPFVIVPALIILAINTFIVLEGAFGRQGVIAVGGGLLWGMYYSHFRYLPLPKQFFRVAAVATIGLAVVAAFTSVRGGGGERLTADQYVDLVTKQSSVQEGVLLLVSGQDAGMISMWLNEMFPERFQTRPLNTLYLFAVYPVPRAIWPGKPDSLSLRIPYMARQRGVTPGVLKIGPGILGHTAAEGGWIAVIIYAGLAALFIRFFDEVLRNNVFNPFIVVAIGAAPGQLLAMSRGESAPFAWAAVFIMTSSWLLLLGIAKTLDMLGWGRTVAVEEADDQEYLDEYEDGDELYYDEAYDEAETARSHA